ncbi:23659_t:CDS:1, partial [Dentiscutata erythropus]
TLLLDTDNIVVTKEAGKDENATTVDVDANAATAEVDILLLFSSLSELPK